jgi:tetratricopeptide (TPR) repeat protein
MSPRQGKSRKAVLAGLMHNRAALLRGSLLLLLLLPAGLAHLKTGFLAQLAVSNSPNAGSFSRELTSPDALVRLARKEHLVNADYVRALALYRRAIEHFALHVPSWLGLVELYNDMGEKEKAVAALGFVQDFSPDNEGTAWARAILAHELDQVGILTANLVRLAENFPGKRPQVFTLADLRWPDPAEMMALFDRAVYPDVLAYYIAVNDAPKAEYAWQRVTESGTATRAAALRYINYLLNLGEVREAALTWRTDYLEEDLLLYNPELELPFINSGFGWRISRADGVDWQQMENGRGLQIRFDGSENPFFRLAQVVPLAPGRYIFSGRVESRDLTTDQRPFWSVAGYQCDGPNVRGEMLPASGPPGAFSLEFTVPDGCHAVQIALLRNKSYYFDNLISGLLRIDGLALEPAAEAAPSDAPLTADMPDQADKEAKPSRTSIDIRKIQVY